MPFFPDCSFGPPARRLAAVAIFGIVSVGSVASAWAAPAPADPDPVLAKVNGQAIHVSDLKAAMATLPAQAQAMPPQQLYPMLLDQLVDEQALLAEAKKTGTRQGSGRAAHGEDGGRPGSGFRPARQSGAPAGDRRSRQSEHDEEYAGKPGETEVHARHILVDDEATAKKIIAELKKGADFAALSKQYSKDPRRVGAGRRPRVTSRRPTWCRNSPTPRSR